MLINMRFKVIAVTVTTGHVLGNTKMQFSRNSQTQDPKEVLTEELLWRQVFWCAMLCHWVSIS